MAEDVVVWILVGLVTVLIGRRFRRALKGGSGSCGCSGEGCQRAGSCDPTVALNVRQDDGRGPT